PADKIEILPNGADLAEFARQEQTRQLIRRQLNFADSDLVMVMLANELERKGFPQVLRAMQQVGDERLKLLCVGRAGIESYGKLISSLSLTGRVLHIKSDPKPQKYLWAADLYILPTQYEAFNLSIIEAQAAGLPVITTALGQADQAVAP